MAKPKHKKETTVHGRSQKAKPLGTTSSGCGYTLKWSLLESTKGLTQVWIPTEAYDRIARGFAKRARGKYEKALFRERMAPLGLDAHCGGTCDGGWCKERLLRDDGSAKLFVCECQYFV